MTAYGLNERHATLAHLKDSVTIAGGRVFQGSLLDDFEVPDDGSGRLLPYIVISFGSPVRTARDRNMAYGEKGQPHVLPLNVACISGDYDWSQQAAAQAHETLLDWAPSDDSDPFESKGGYGTRRPSTASVPTRYVEGLFFEAVVNSILLPEN